MTQQHRKDGLGSKVPFPPNVNTQDQFCHPPLLSLGQSDTRRESECASPPTEQCQTQQKLHGAIQGVRCQSAEVKVAGSGPHCSEYQLVAVLIIAVSAGNTSWTTRENPRRTGSRVCLRLVIRNKLRGCRQQTSRAGSDLTKQHNQVSQ